MQHLSQNQQRATLAIRAAWNQGRPFVLRVGMRGGKTPVAAAVVASEPSVLVVAHTRSMAEHIAAAVHNGAPDQVVRAVGVRQFADYVNNLLKTEAAKPAIILDNAFWLTNAEELFKQACALTPRVLAMSSAHGCEDAWEHVPDMTFATWEFHPLLAKGDEVFATAEQTDPVRFQRDFASGQAI